MHMIKKYFTLLYILSILSPLQGINDDYESSESVLVFPHELSSLLNEEANDSVYRSMATAEEMEEVRGINPKKPLTIVVYVAADNDLHPFAWKNIKQMETIGSNENVNIVVQINTPGYFNLTKRYIIKNGKRLLVPADGPAPTQKLNSGSPQTLIDCVAWAAKYYPSENLILNLWNHGAGPYDPGASADNGKKNLDAIDPFNLFRFNEATNMIELNRSVEYDEGIDKNQEHPVRGICFDETFKSYLTNQDLKFALSEIHNNILKGKKIGAIWFDACLMSMIEIANICKDHAEYLVGSQEVEFASGSNYELVLQPFTTQVLSSRDFACHVVNSYEKAYQQITRDYTQSAMDLSAISKLETNINLIAAQILWGIQDQRNNSVIKVLQQSKARQSCVCFQEPSYIDLRNFYINLQANLGSISLNNSTTEVSVKQSLKKLLDQGINLINSAVIANKVGSNLAQACGISIYFPERGMFNSYPKCNFAQTNNWSTMLMQYLLHKK